MSMKGACWVQVLNLFLSVPYLAVRVVVWLLLFLVALTDTIRHRHVKRRGHQLQRGVLFVIGAFIVQDILLLAYAAQNTAESPTAQLRLHCKRPELMLISLLYLWQASSMAVAEDCCLDAAGLVACHCGWLLVSGIHACSSSRPRPGHAACMSSSKA